MSTRACITVHTSGPCIKEGPQCGRTISQPSRSVRQLPNMGALCLDERVARA